MLQCVAVFGCRASAGYRAGLHRQCMLQCVAVCIVCRMLTRSVEVVCCSVMQCVAACCSVLQCVAVRPQIFDMVLEARCCSGCCSVCCSVLQCVAVRLQGIEQLSGIH